MRSEYVFAAVKEVSNRYLLCRVASISTRRLHRDSARASETINKSLNLIAEGESPRQVESDAEVSETTTESVNLIAESESVPEADADAHAVTAGESNAD
jgi:hypothetical protein